MEKERVKEESVEIEKTDVDDVHKDKKSEEDDLIQEIINIEEGE